MTNPCSIMCTEIKELYKEYQGAEQNWDQRLCADCCASPSVSLYACFCPAAFAGQISAKQGGNCCASCCFHCLCPLCAICAYDIPDRHKVGKSSRVEDCSVCLFCCCGMLMRIQLAAELGMFGHELPAAGVAKAEETPHTMEEAKTEAVVTSQPEAGAAA
ncbi:hypothetical protein M885DRAFT_545719 [Pelagophyceae sp. CCMP2097]|nr:hypothetical protein M885DRAFT_545719 [Pelagophyceae sp. CCMP2097]